MAEKLYYSMGEVTEMFDVEPSLIRYWCSQFSCLKPKRNAKGNRLFSPQDIEHLKRIHHLLKERRMTIEGAKKAMRKRAIEAEANDSDMALLEQLQSLRAMLVDMRECIGGEMPMAENSAEDVAAAEPVKEIVTEEQSAEEQSVEEEVIVEVAPVEDAPVEVAPIEEVSVEEISINDVFVEESVAEPEQKVEVEQKPEPAPKKKRAPRRKLIGEEGVVERPLFPFYEQTLF